MNECGILNTGDSSTNGFHWMCSLCWHKTGTVKLYFDSYALPPPVELVNYLSEAPATKSRGSGHVYYNSERLHHGDTVFCGHLCLYVLKKLDDGCDFQTIVNELW